MQKIVITIIIFKQYILFITIKLILNVALYRINYSNFLNSKYYNLIINMINNISYQQFNQISQECLYSTDYNIKTTRETFLFNFTKNLTLNQFAQILQNLSQNTLLTVCFYMKHNIQSFTDITSLYLLMIKLLISWFQADGKIVRNNQVLQYHVYNIYTNLIGITIKKLYVNQSNKSYLIKQILGHPKLFLLLQWKIFLESTVEKENQINFIKYRNRIWSIQMQILPKILNLVEDYLNVLTSKIKFNEIIYLQQKLTLSQSQKNQSSSFKLLSFSKQQVFISEKLFILLESVLNFSFNNTYNDSDDCKYSQFDQNYSIFYPDNIAYKLIESTIYDSLFLFTQRLLVQQSNNIQPIKKCIKILQRFVQCRIPFINKQIKRQFREKSLKGMSALIKNTNSFQIIDQIISFNLKMIQNYSIRKLKKIQPAFSEWFQFVFIQTIYIVKNIEYKIENKVFTQSLKLIKIIIDNTIKEQIEQHRKLICKYCEIILSHIMHELMKDINLLKHESIAKIKQFKYFTLTFFQNIKYLIIFNSEFSLNLLLNFSNIAFDEFRNLSKRNYFMLTNLFMLLSELNQEEFLNSHITKKIINQKAIQTYGKLILNSVDFMNYYNLNKNIDCFQLQVALFLFNESLIKECLQKIEIKIVSRNPLKYKILSLNNIFNCIPLIPKDQSIEPFLIFSFTQIINQFKSNDIRRVDYALKVLSYNIWKLKWRMEKKIFFNMNLLKSILKNCYQLVVLDFTDVKLIKCRYQLFKIIATLTLPKNLENYEVELSKIVSLAKGNQQLKNFHKVLSIIYDLKGIVSELQQEQYFRYFLLIINPILSGINNYVFYQNINNCNPRIMKALLKFHKQILENKYFRLSNSKSLIRVLQQINQMFYYWNSILLFLSTIQINYTLISVSSQIYQNFSELLKQNYFNIYQILQFQNNCLQSFLLNFLKFTIKILPQLFSYPKYTHKFFNTIMIISRYLLNLIFQFVNQQFVVLYSNIFLLLKTPCFTLIKQFNSQSARNEDLLKQILQTMENMTSYIKDVQQMKRKQLYIKKLVTFKSINVGQKISLIIELLKQCWSQVKQFSTLKDICKIIINLIELYSEHYQVINTNFYCHFSIRQSQILHYLFKKQSQEQLDHNVLALKISVLVKKSSVIDRSIQ